MNFTQFIDQQILSNLRNEAQVSNKNSVIWPNVFVTANECRYSKTMTESSLVVISNTSGESILHIDKRKIKVCEQTYFIVNPYQSFEYEIKSEQNVRTSNVHFNFHFFNEALASFRSSDEQLLMQPDTNNIRYSFYNQLNYKTNLLNQIVSGYNSDEPEQFFLNMLQFILENDEAALKTSQRIQSKKASTQKELYRRIALARDIIFSNYTNAELTLDELSKEVAMSRFHFLRVFREVTGLSPYQFLKRVRIERARHLIRENKYLMSEIAEKVGLTEPNSLYPILNKYNDDRKERIKN